MKVVRREDSSDSGICQNPALASSLEKILAPASCPKVCSTDGSGCFSLITDLFSSVRSVQILTRPVLLGTTTMAVHHAVGSSTFEITPCCSMRVSSSLTFGMSGRDMRRGVEREKGFAPGFSTMVYSPYIFPSREKRFGNSLFTVSLVSRLMLFTQATS